MSVLSDEFRMKLMYYWIAHPANGKVHKTAKKTEMQHDQL